MFKHLQKNLNLVESALFQKEVLNKSHILSKSKKVSNFGIKFSTFLLLAVSPFVLLSQAQAAYDDDGDGIPTAVEGIGDTDGDSIPDYEDTDSDNDGYDDIIEGVGDVDCDTFPNYVDADDSDGPCGDIDEDGLTNEFEEIIGSNPENSDSDGDGVSDDVELGSGVNPQDTDSDNIIDILDPDDDGDTLTTRFERDRCNHGPMLGLVPIQNSSLQLNLICRSSNSAIDSDGDGIPDYLDENSDSDFLNPNPYDEFTDYEEAQFTIDDLDGDLIPNVYDPNDFDGPDGDPDLDGLTNEEEAFIGTNPYDDDSDDDNLFPDGWEVGDDYSNPTDTDGDGIIDALDVDDDGDGIVSSEEGAADIDGDGVGNHQDHDSDGDGFPDACEGAPDADVDGDGLPNFLDSNDTNGPNAGGMNFASGTGDRDCDGIIDHIDPNDMNGSCGINGPSSISSSAGADDPNFCVESPYASTSNNPNPQARQFIQPKLGNVYETRFGKQSYQLNDISLAKNALCDWQCRQRIGKIINAKVGKTPLVCDQVKMGKEIRMSCDLNGVDLSIWLIQNGWAKTNKYSSKTAILAQNKAKKKGLGFWKTGK